jgi:tetratricopeptide (TPR) repeat protein
MSVFLSPAARAFGLTITLSVAASAQEKACEVNEGRPSQVARATLEVQLASSAQNPADVSKRLTSAVKLLTDNGERMDNQPGRNFVLGKALVLWTMQPNVQLDSKRGPLGYTTNPEGTVDLAAAIDSAFKVVEAAHPECVAETTRWRGQKGWVDLVNKAIERLNADDVTEAEAAAQRAILLNPYAPYGYVVMANVKQKKNASSEAFALYRKSVDMAGRDTSYDDIRRQSLVYLGNLAADSAEAAADAAARKPYVDVASQAFNELLKDQGATDFAGNARAGLCRVAIATGDTASLRVTYRDPLASPAGYGYGDLMNAGVCMARAEMVPEATKLFFAAYEKNPYHRDALSNLAVMLLRTDDHTRALPLASRLVAVEPNNAENLQLLVLSYAGIAKTARDTRLAAARPTSTKAGSTKAPARPAAGAAPRLSAAAADSLFKIEKAYTDSAVSTNERKEKLAVKVQLSDFTTSDEKSAVSGTVTNLSSAAKDITVKVEFMDKDGKVIQTKEAAVGSVAAGASSRFNVTVTPGTSIASFRYTRID